MWGIHRARHKDVAVALTQLQVRFLSNSTSQGTGARVMREITEASRRKQTGVPLKHLFEFGRNVTPSSLLVGAQFLHKELPIRLAKRVTELGTLPYGLSDMPSVQLVKNAYTQSFTDIVTCAPPEDKKSEEHFTDVLEFILKRHENTVPTMARGVLELKNTLGVNGSNGIDAIVNCPFLQDFLDRFYVSRIGMRMLMSQHIALHSSTEGYVGVIDSQCCVSNVARAAADDADMICERHLGFTPPIIIDGNRNLEFRYVPGHLYHLVFEVVKNSIRATIDTHGHKKAKDIPPVNIVIADGEDEIAVKISDQGGGMARKDVELIWQYMYTTAPFQQPPKDLDNMADPPMAGFGYGLPTSRLYAQYFGGDMQAISMDGYGTDMYIYLSKLGEAEEPLP